MTGTQGTMKISIAGKSVQGGAIIVTGRNICSFGYWLFAKTISSRSIYDNDLNLPAYVRPHCALFRSFPVALAHDSFTSQAPPSVVVVVVVSCSRKSHNWITPELPFLGVLLN